MSSASSAGKEMLPVVMAAKGRDAPKRATAIMTEASDPAKNASGAAAPNRHPNSARGKMSSATGTSKMFHTKDSTGSRPKYHSVAGSAPSCAPVETEIVLQSAYSLGWGSLSLSSFCAMGVPMQKMPSTAP